MFGREKGAKSSVLQELCHFVILIVCCCNMANSAYFVKKKLLEHSVYPFDTLQICYRYIEVVHEEV